MDNLSWVCTDPDQGQYCRRHCGHKYEYKDSATQPVIINLDDYTVVDIENYIHAFGYTLYHSTKSCSNIFELYRYDAWMVIAECIFETKFSKMATG